jgi:hypothetical protein
MGRRITLIASALVCLGLSAFQGCPFGSVQTKPPARATVEKWLLMTCEKHAPNELTNELRSIDQDTARFLLDSAWRYGPPFNLVEDRKQTSIDQYQALQSTTLIVASLVDTTGASAMTQLQFINQEATRFKKHYRARGLLGLAVVADTSTLSAITLMSLDTTNPQHKIAADALRMRSGYYQ